MDVNQIIKVRSSVNIQHIRDIDRTIKVNIAVNGKGSTNRGVTSYRSRSQCRCTSIQCSAHVSVTVDRYQSVGSQSVHGSRTINVQACIQVGRSVNAKGSTNRGVTSYRSRSQCRCTSIQCSAHVSVTVDVSVTIDRYQSVGSQSVHGSRTINVQACIQVGRSVNVKGWASRNRAIQWTCIVDREICSIQLIDCTFWWSDIWLNGYVLNSSSVNIDVLSTHKIEVRSRRRHLSCIKPNVWRFQSYCSAIIVEVVKTLHNICNVQWSVRCILD